MNFEAAIALLESHRAWFIERRICGMDPGPYFHARSLTPLSLHQLNGRKPPVERRQLNPEGTAARRAARID